jgi:hypothetical protein
MSRKSQDILEMKIHMLAKQGGRCENCHRPLALSDCQLAHRIPQTKYNLRTYGKTVLHHEYNLAAVCSLRCNSAVLLSPATHPIEAAELVTKIQMSLERKDK